MAGKRADIILIHGDDIDVPTVADIEASVVQSATPANVDTGLVDGRIVSAAASSPALDKSFVTQKPQRCASVHLLAANSRPICSHMIVKVHRRKS